MGTAIFAVLGLAAPFMHAQTPAQDFQAAKNYHDGRGVAQDYTAARELYERAAARGSGAAMLNLGYIYYMGEGVARDYDMARDWYIRAAEKNISGAQQNLDMLYKLGLSSPPINDGPAAPPRFKAEPKAEPNAEPEPAPMTEPTTLSEEAEAPANKAEAQILPLPAQPTMPNMEAVEPDKLDIDIDAPEAFEIEAPAQAGAVLPDTQILDTPALEVQTPNIQIQDRSTLSAPPLSAQAPTLSPLSSLLWPLAAALMLLAALLALWRYATGASGRFVKSFVGQHDYGLRRMYDNFVSTPGTSSNQRIWRAALTDMIGRFTGEPEAQQAHPKLSEKLQMDYKAGGVQMEKSFTPLLDRAERLIVKSYRKKGAPD